jgi:DNA-binding GntR family transcriptional regulator
MEAEATLAREFGISRETAVAAARHKRHQDRDH